ncbi:pentapeptide repeat-containing protein [Streptomyces sp. NPDC102259]|uniref:pentapeptide repeat-containing protein n=1 Tax=Streptomyces sp. NPDC102259 TaxID=3366148 RepID=UPI003814AD52
MLALTVLWTAYAYLSDVWSHRPVQLDVWNSLTGSEKATTVGQWHTLLIQAFLALAAVCTLIFTASTYALSRRVQTTALLMQAIERLESPVDHVKEGGVRNIEQVMRDSRAHHGLTVDLLVSFIQNEIPEARRETGGVNPDSYYWHTTRSGQAALEAIARRPRGRQEVEIDLSNLHLGDANLENARLNFANLAKSRLRFLKHSKLKFANLIQANMYRANLMEANLYRARMDHTTLIDARLKRAYMRCASLHNAHLEGARLQEVNLKHAALRRAHLQGADITGARLAKADLRGADLTGVVGAELKQLKKARIDESTILPDGFSWGVMDGLLRIE